MGVRNPDEVKEAKPRGKKPAPRELGCELRMGKGAARVVRRGRAALGADELHFHTGRTGRGGKDFSLHIRYEEITGAEVDVPDGTLTLSVTGQDTMILQLGKHASDWKKMIEERPTPLDELGVDKKARVGVVAIEDDEFLKLLATRVPALAAEEAGDLDLLFVGVEHRADLSQLSALSRRLRHGGVLWALTREKGRAPEAHEIAAAGRSAGLLSGNVVEVSRTLQAVRLNKA